MTAQDILAQRLTNQKFVANNLNSVAELVGWFGAVQSQDYQGAKWALGQRLGVRDKEIEEAFNEGKILRTHIMRPTWHFVTPADISWMQKLTSHRVNRIMSYYNKALGLDREFFNKANGIIVAALSGGKFLTRLEIGKVLEENGISIKGQKLGHVVSQAELDTLICSGPRIGKQFTYALIKDRVSKIKEFIPQNPLAELVKRYFQSHGPATVRDFVWWSGLTTADARKGIEENMLKSENVDGKKYFFLEKSKFEKLVPNNLLLLPNYDEYTIAYQDREVLINPSDTYYFKDQGNAAFWNAIIYRGVVIGMWKRTFGIKELSVKAKFFKKPNVEIMEQLQQETEKLGRFFDLKVSLLLP